MARARVGARVITSSSGKLFARRSPWESTWLGLGLGFNPNPKRSLTLTEKVAAGEHRRGVAYELRRVQLGIGVGLELGLGSGSGLGLGVAYELRRVHLSGS